MGDRKAAYGAGGAAAAANGVPAFNDLTLSPGAQRYRSQLAADAQHSLARTILPPQVYAGLLGAGDSMTFGMGGEVAARLNAAKQGLLNAIAPVTGGKPGPSMADTYAGQMQFYRDELRNAQANSPVSMAAGQIAGGFASPGAATVSKLVAAPSIAAKTIKGTGVAAKVARAAVAGAETTAKSSLAGATYGALNGAGNADNGARLQGAEDGAKAGAMFGAIAPAALRTGGAAVKYGAAPVVNGAMRLANKASGGQLLDPAVRVSQLLGQTLAADYKARGVAPEDIPAAVQAEIDRWKATGSPTPNLMNVAGENTRAAMRTAASQVGPARTLAQDFADRTAANLQGLAINRTRALTPGESRPASDIFDRLTAQRDNDATTQYRAPYAAMVDPTPVISNLTGDAGARGISEALRESDAMQLDPQVQELKALRAAAKPQAGAPDPALTPAVVPGADPEAVAWAQRLVGGQPLDHDAVSLGTLDRLKVAFNRLGDKAADDGAPGEAAGYYGRASEIDNHLANLAGPEGEHYRLARDNYAKISGQIEAMKSGDINVANEDPDLLRIAVAKMTPEERNFAQVQMRQNLTNAIGAPTEGAIGALNRISTSDNATNNLATMFGPDEAANYQAAIKNSVDQVNQARFVAPNTGPKSANLLLDAEAATRPHHVSLDPIDWAMMARRAGMLLTPQESQMLVSAGQAPATPDVPVYQPPDYTPPPSILGGLLNGYKKQPDPDDAYPNQ